MSLSRIRSFDNSGQRFLCGGSTVTNLDSPEHLFIDRNVNAGVVDSVLVPICDNSPLDPGHRGITHDLPRPFSVFEVLAPCLRFQKELRRPDQRRRHSQPAYLEV